MRTATADPNQSCNDRRRRAGSPIARYLGPVGRRFWFTPRGSPRLLADSACANGVGRLAMQIETPRARRRSPSLPRSTPCDCQLHRALPPARSRAAAADRRGPPSSCRRIVVVVGRVRDRRRWRRSRRASRRGAERRHRRRRSARRRRSSPRRSARGSTRRRSSWWRTRCAASRARARRRGPAPAFAPVARSRRTRRRRPAELRLQPGPDGAVAGTCVCAFLCVISNGLSS